MERQNYNNTITTKQLITILVCLLFILIATFVAFTKLSKTNDDIHSAEEKLTKVISEDKHVSKLEDVSVKLVEKIIVDDCTFTVYSINNVFYIRLNKSNELIRID